MESGRLKGRLFLSERIGLHCALFLLLLRLGQGFALGAVDSWGVVANDTTLSLDQRIDFLRQQLRHSDQRAALCHALGCLLMSQDTPPSRLRADKYLYRAILLAPDSVAYHVDYATLQRRRGFHYNAMKYFQKVLAIDSNNAVAASEVGDYYLRDMLKYLDARRFDGEGSMRGFAMESVGLAGDYYRRAIASNPYYRPAYYGLATLSFEGGFYEDMVRIAENLLKRCPEDRDGLLLLGLGHYALGDFGASSEAFGRAMAGMDAHGRAVMTDLSLFTDLPGADFWTSRDPLLLTRENERQLAHWGRVAYANMRFGLPDEGLAGWDTDMGRTWIRYGRYVHRDRTLIPHREIWSYEDFEIAFHSFDSIHWRLDLMRDARWALNPVGGFGRGEVFGEGFDLVERYVDPYADQKYVLPHQVALFKGTQGRVRLGMSWAIPKKNLTYLKLYNTYQVDVASGLFLRPTGSDSIQEYRWRQQVFREAWFDSSKARFLLGEKTIEIEPDSLFVTLEVQDSARPSIGVVMDTLWAPPFDSTRVALSSLVLATSVSETEDGTISVVPNPLRTFASDEPLYVYFEVYNLTRDAFGQTDFSVSYQVGPPGLGRFKGAERNRLKAMRAEQNWRISVRSDYLGREVDERLYLAVDLSEVPPGLHLLGVVVTDHHVGVQDWQEKLFVIPE